MHPSKRTISREAIRLDDVEVATASVENSDCGRSLSVPFWLAQGSGTPTCLLPGGHVVQGGHTVIGPLGTRHPFADNHSSSPETCPPLFRAVFRRRRKVASVSVDVTSRHAIAGCAA